MNTEQTREALEEALGQILDYGPEEDYDAALARHEAACKAEALRNVLRVIESNRNTCRRNGRKCHELDAAFIEYAAARIEQEATK